MENPYLILGVARDAPDYVIQAAYRACLKRFHPDQYKGPDASKRTGDIVAAYEVLRDPVKRIAVDSRLDSARSSRKASTPPPPPPPPRPEPSASAHPQKLEKEKTSQWPAFTALGIIGLILFSLSATERKDATSADMTALETEANLDASADTVADPLNYAFAPTEDAANAAEEAAASIEDGALISLPHQAEAVSFSNVETASKRFFSVFQKDGMIGARRVSEQCHEQQTQSPTWEGLDYCAAFDFAADMMDRGFASSSGASRNAYFEFQAANQADYYLGRQTYPRLNSVRNASQTALSEAMQRYLSRQQQARQAALEKEWAKAAEADTSSADLNADLSIDHSTEPTPN